MTDDGLNAGAVARRLGVAVTTLRTWHQRYGLGPSEHVPGHHRRYTAADLARLETMRRLTSQGVPAAEAARWARRPVPDTPTTGRHGGGSTIPLGRAGAAARGLAHAAMRLDVAAMRDLVERSVAQDGVVETWNTVLRPVLVGIGERHATTSALVEVEHLLSRTISEVLGAVPRPTAADAAPAVLLACADEEQHSLPLEALAAALAEASVPCRLLGARVPPNALRDAIARTGPTVVAVWAQLARNADPAQLGSLLTGIGRPLLLIAAGPGWPVQTLPPEIAVPGSLDEAVALITAAAGEISTSPDSVSDTTQRDEHCISGAATITGGNEPRTVRRASVTHGETSITPP